MVTQEPPTIPAMASPWGRRLDQAGLQQPEPVRATSPHRQIRTEAPQPPRPDGPVIHGPGFDVPATPQLLPAPGLPAQAVGFLSSMASRAASLVTGAASYIAGNDLLPAGHAPRQGSGRDTPTGGNIPPAQHGQRQDVFSAEAGFSDIPLHDALPEAAPLPSQPSPRGILSRLLDVSEPVPGTPGVPAEPLQLQPTHGLVDGGALSSVAGLRTGSQDRSFMEPPQRRRASDVRSPPPSPDSDESDTHDRFATPLSSMRWEASGRRVLQHGLLEAAGVREAGGAGAAVHPDPDASAPPPSRWTVLRAGLERGLGEWQFSATNPEQLAAQVELEARYLDRAAQVAERRERAFGTTQPYQVGQPMRTQVREGLLPAAYESFQSFVTSAFRSPSGAVIGLSVQDNRNFFPIDQALTTSLLQGFMAYVAEGAMVAVNNRATLSNMPTISRNNFDGLFYEQEIQPDTVLLVVKDGRKEYMRADDPRACSAEAEAEKVGRKLSSIKLRQDQLDGKSFGFSLVPLMSGGFNTFRRFLSSASVLASPLPLFVTSALASGSASGVVKLGLEVGKTAAQVEIDDLMGGRQSVNLFRLSRPHADIEPLRWADAKRLHRFLGETFLESLSLANEARRTWQHSAADMAYRYILVNGIANISAVGIGGMMGQVFRPERHFGALPGESPQSRGNIAGQMVQSTFGDAIWRGLKEPMKGRELDANASLKLRRATRMAEMSKVALREQGNLRTLVRPIREDSAIWAAQPPAVLESHGDLRSRLSQDRPMDLDTLHGLRRDLAALDLREAGQPERESLDALKRQLDRIIKPLQCRAAIWQWLQPRE